MPENRPAPGMRRLASVTHREDASHLCRRVAPGAGKKSSKVKTDLTWGVLWELMAETGLRPVTQVSVDDTWSAMRFRPTEEVGR